MVTETQYLALIKVSNQGARTAKSLLIIGMPFDGDSVIESSEVTFDYLPSGSSRQGGLFFSHKPDAFRLELNASGYQDP